MKAIKVEIVLPDNSDGEYFITQVLPKLKKEYSLNQVGYYKCEWFER